MKATLQEIGIVPSEKVLINWFRFDQIDKMKSDDVSQYFDDFWYPAADAIDIFDRSLTWIVSVGYSGDVSLFEVSSSDVMAVELYPGLAHFSLT